MNVARFQLVESVLRYSHEPPEIWCTAVVPDASDELFKGHFPGMPLLPGNLMLEVMAQASGLLDFRRNEGRKLSLLAGVERARFRSPIMPGTQLECVAQLTCETPPMSGYKSELRMGKTIAASAEIRLISATPPNEEVARYMNALARTIGLYGKHAE